MLGSDDLRRSKMRQITIGIVAENKELDTSIVRIHPVEILNTMDGELGADTFTDETTGLNEDGSTYKDSVSVGSVVKAEWLGDADGNRITPPDVRRGEKVWLWQSGDSDKYYWTSLGRDHDLRRLETVNYRYSGFPDIPDEEITADNSYYVEVSTHKKIITLKTSKRNKELVSYKIQINPGDGNITIEDDIGNHIQLDSKNTNIRAKNASGTYVELNKTNIYGSAPELVRISCTDLQVNAGNSVSFKVGNSFTINAKSISLKADTVSIDAGNMSFSGGGSGGVSISSDTTLNINSVDAITISSPIGGVTINGNSRSESW